jgi:putative ABC transport system permease protein
MIVARTQGEMSALARRIEAEVAAIDPNQPVAAIRAMADLVSADLAQPRFTMWLAAGFAAAALLLAAVGLYGVIAFGVAQRTREIGVRMALGATPHDVLRLVLRQGLGLTAAGLALGGIVTLAVGRFIASLLFGISPTDLATLVPVAIALAIVALLATYLPARRATRVDPTLALHAE